MSLADLAELMKGGGLPAVLLWMLYQLARQAMTAWHAQGDARASHRAAVLSLMERTHNDLTAHRADLDHVASDLATFRSEARRAQGITADA